MKTFLYIESEKRLRPAHFIAHEVWAMNRGFSFRARRWHFGSGEKRFPAMEVDYVVEIREPAVAVYVDLRLFIPGVGLAVETVAAITEAIAAELH